MHITLGRVIILVDDYDKAFYFYEKNFFCKKVFDAVTPDGQRYIHAGFNNDSTGIWFLLADTIEQKDKIGKQTAGQPTLVLYTDESENLYKHLVKNGVKITEELAITDESRYFHCLDLYGNRITIVELSKVS